MIAPLLTTLANCADSEGIKAFLDVEITGHFGMPDGEVETGEMAQRLTTWWPTT